jgi:hypothetical protein
MKALAFVLALTIGVRFCPASPLGWPWFGSSAPCNVLDYNGE